MSEWAVSLVCGLLGVQTTILIAAIPWAYSMRGRVTRIEAAAGLAAGLGERVNSLESRVFELDPRDSIELTRSPSRSAESCGMSRSTPNSLTGPWKPEHPKNDGSFTTTSRDSTVHLAIDHPHQRPFSRRLNTIQSPLKKWTHSRGQVTE